MIVAIDGPAGSGKGSVTKLIAKRTGLLNLDTGITYRCVALASLQKGFELDQEKEIIDLANQLEIECKYDRENLRVFLNGEDVTREIRSNEVSSIVSQISSIIPVRLRMNDIIRDMAKGKSVIAEGRDIGTCVFPNADVKIYLDANQEERAKRRFKENQEKGIGGTYDEILENIKLRDQNDKNKKFGALKIADDAIVIDSTGLSVEQVADKIEDIIFNKK